ncbi:MAG TPA: hypothetical protein VJ123_04650 [Anaerolineales bacterium]|nr:hypothetical protein [Anaerolineales bacterium]
MGLNALPPEFLAAFTPEYLANLCAELTLRVLGAAGRRLQEAIVGAQKEQALEGCRRAAVLGEVCLRASLEGAGTANGVRL